MYNRKMMALYKKNGYSMWGACLPTILTLVIFIVAINAFTDYSKFQNKTYFYNMSNSYNNVVYAGFDVDEQDRYIYRDAKGKLIVKCEDIISADKNGDNKLNNQDTEIDSSVGFNNNFDIEYNVSVDDKDENGRIYSTFTLTTTNSYITYKYTFYEENGNKTWIKESFEPREDVLSGVASKDGYILATAENNFLKINGKTFDELKDTVKETKNETDILWTAERFILDIRQSKSAETYRNEQQSFFWVKNIWATDSPTSHPIESNWSTFMQTHGYNGANISAVIDVNGDNGYNSLIKKLDYEKTAPNGYFILVALTALSSLLMQIITGKAQKAQMELQTVNGQGAQTQKIMQWMMPIMMAVFAFMYTAAFSVYIVVSSLISVGTTYLINFVVDLEMKKESQNKKTEKVHGRIKVTKTPAKEQPKKEKKVKDNKFAHETGGDFLTGKVKVKKNKK